MNSSLEVNAAAKPVTRLHARRLPFYVLIGMLLSLFFVPSWGSHGGRLASYAHDLSHFPVFATIAAGLLSVWRRNWHVIATAGSVVATALAIALLIEYFQPLVGRSAALNDVLLGAAGAIAAVSIYLAFKTSSLRGRRLYVALAVLAALACILPLLILTADWYLAARAFPVVDSFERPVEMGRWKAEGCTISQSREHVTQGKYALKMEVSDAGAKYPSLFMADGPMDWRGYGRFAVDVYLDGEASKTVWIRADDRNNPPYKERAQMPVELKPGMNTIWVDLRSFSQTPSGRLLDLAHVQTVGLFLEKAVPGDTLFIDRMVLSAKSTL